MTTEAPIDWEHVAKFNEAIFKGERRLTQRAITRALAAEAALAEAVGEIERLRKGLKPFADEADELPNSVVNMRFGYQIDGVSFTTFFDTSDLRAARAALEAKP